MPFAFFKRKNKENSDKNVILEEKVKTIDGSPTAKQDMATAEQEVNDEQDTENNKTPEEHLNNKGHHDTENNKTPEEHLNNKGHHDTENKKTPEEHLNNKGHHDTENNKTPEEHLNNKGHHDTENNKTPDEHLNNKGHHDTENNQTSEVHLNNKGHHDKEGAEDVQGPADEVVPAVLEVNPEKENKREKITQEAEDSQDGTPSEKTALDEQVGKEVSDQQPKTSNGMKIEESSPLIKKQEPDMEIACCVIL